MRQMIQNLRSKPERVRRQILHVLTIGFGIILVFLWIYSLGTNLNNPDTQAKAENDLEPFSALKANVIDGYQSLSQ